MLWFRVTVLTLKGHNSGVSWERLGRGQYQDLNVDASRLIDDELGGSC
jgi:hypothetical protein